MGRPRRQSTARESPPGQIAGDVKGGAGPVENLGEFPSLATGFCSIK